ncbi:angiopoietin-related protein 7-like [Zophobas morio]|uniref:angiopoietin-related protein 7-like n=1 Tax=Zophobas morio TaxID=2755281 RepID=UPI0030835FCD
MHGKWAWVWVLVAAEVAAFQRGQRVRHDARGNASTTCDISQINYRLTRLEVQTAEKSDHLNSELQETNRRLHALEWQTTDVHTAVDEFRIQLHHYTQTNQPGTKNGAIPGQLELKIDNLGKGLQIVVAALRSLRADIWNIRKNVSAIAESTKSCMHRDDNLVTKSFLTDSLNDVKHHHLMQHPPTSHGSDDFPRNCLEILEGGNNVSGIYRIQPELSPRPFMAVCEMESRGGGWTYIQNRHEGDKDFYLNWHSYKIGFGNLGGEFWLGLEYLHQLTGSEVNELLIELEDLEGKRVYAHYEAFSVGSEVEGYALKVLAGYSGDAGDSLTYHAGSKFSTKDLDQDEWQEGSCAQAHTGAWWYRNCDTSNLNGKYLKGPTSDDHQYQGMYWGEFHGSHYSLRRARMMVRPHSINPALLSDNQEVPPSY